MVYISVIGIFQTLITAFLLSINSRQKPASTYLLLFVICLMLHLTSSLLLYIYVDNHSFQNGFYSFFALIYGPLLYAYTRKLTNFHFSAASSFFSFLPACICGVVYLLIVGRWIENPSGNFGYIKYYNSSLMLMLAVVNIPYSVKCLRLIRAFEKELTKEKQLIRLLSWTIIVLALVMFIFLVVVLSTKLPLRSFHIISHFLVAFGLILSCLAIFTYRIRVYSANDVPIANGIIRVGKPLHLASVTSEKQTELPVGKDGEDTNAEVRTGLISRERQAEIYKHLDKVMREQKLFLNPDLNMEKLIQASKISRHYISEVLNNYAKTNFYHFINEYRVNMVCEQMRKTSYQSSVVTLEFLGKSCGFKSKTSFNEYFKKIKGLTPSEYWRKSVTNNISENDADRLASMG